MKGVRDGRRLEEVGPLQFEPGELDAILDDIQALRDMEVETDEQLFA